MWASARGSDPGASAVKLGADGDVRPFLVETSLVETSMSLADLETRAEQGDVRAQVQWAVLLEAQGRDYDALRFLALAAQADDPEAMARLGLKLVTGSGAPQRPADGVSLLSDAAGRGDPRAAELLAVLAAGGFFMPQSWSRALDHLQRSAELGSSASREELRILAGAPAAGGEQDWRQLRQGVDLQPWLARPECRVLRDSPRILAIDALASPLVCDWIVRRCEGRLAPAEVDDPRTGLPVMGRTRTNRLANFGLAETSVLNILLQTRIGAAIGSPLAVMEAFAVLNYRPGEEASDHFDYLDPGVPAYAEEISRVGQRIATALVYLNEDYEAGETDFPELGLSHRGAKGDALVFFSVDPRGSPDPRTRHAGRPTTKGEKWVLSQFVRDRPVAPGPSR